MRKIGKTEILEAFNIFGTGRSPVPLWKVAVFYLLLSAAFAWKLLLPGFHFYRWDTLLYTWPILSEVQSQVLSGNMPFWAPSVCCGTDLLANINLGILYPPRLLSIFLPLEAGYSLLLFIHIWLSFTGMHLLMRRGFRLSTGAAFVSALAFTCSGYSRAMWDSINFTALPWIPLALYSLLLARNKDRIIPSILCSSIAISMMFLGGDFQAALLWPPAALLLILMMKERKNLIIAFVPSLLIAVLLCSPQLLVSIKASALSYRAEGMSFMEAAERSFHPVRLIELIFPHAFGSHGGWHAPSLFGEDAASTSPWIASFHIGSFSLVAAFCAWRKRRHTAVKWASLILLASLVLSFGRFTPLFSIWRKIPVIEGFRYPEKYLLWSTFAMALLAGFGANCILPLFQRKYSAELRHRLVTAVTLILFLSTAACIPLIRALNIKSVISDRWLFWQTAGITLVYLTALICARLSRTRKGLLYPLAIVFACTIIPWYAEQPLTQKWDPMKPVPAASQILNSSMPNGRIITDSALTRAPLPIEALKAGGKVSEASVLPSRFAFNSARTWGLRSADGFSPLESEQMRSYRLKNARPRDGTADIESFASFCSDSGAAWILTDGKRAEHLMSRLSGLDKFNSWGSDEQVVLLKRKGATEAVFIGADTASEENRNPAVKAVWRLRPNTIRIDISPGSSRVLFVSESFSPGWRAVDQSFNNLKTFAVRKAFIGVTVPEGTNQVRLTFTPPGWRTGLLAALCGVIVFAALLLAASHGMIYPALKRPYLPVFAALIIFSALSISARNRWACTYDEGFHLSRGLGRIIMNDSRLNYYHPPLQNAFCAYFAKLAYGEQIRFPKSSGWHSGDIQRFATEFASSNRFIFPGLVRASRWGSMILGLLLCFTGVLWAHRAGGAIPAWIAAFGFACNPSIITHGNLTTTDMGVTAAVLSASFMIWQYIKSDRVAHLYAGTLLYVLASMLKFTGLVWLAGFLLISLPLICAVKRSARPMLALPAAAAAFFALLLLAYGTGLQTVRVNDPGWAAGSRIIAGRYLEGLFRQGTHILEGHRAYFAGTQFFRSSWYHMPMTLVVKHPLAWSAAALPAIFLLTWRSGRKIEKIIPFIPLALFSVMFITTNKLALGIRHILPIVPFMTLAVAVAAGGSRKHLLSGAAAFILAVASCSAVIQSFPDFLSYYPIWAGGLDKGHYWSVDSNYDWGQGLEKLEKEWAGITSRNNEKPPHLLYYGFIDPGIIYGMETSSPSWGGYMQWYSSRDSGQEKYSEWKSALADIEGSTAASISMLKLRPFGIDLSYFNAFKTKHRMQYEMFLFQP